MGDGSGCFLLLAGLRALLTIFPSFRGTFLLSGCLCLGLCFSIFLTFPAPKSLLRRVS